MYDPQADAWAQLASMGVARRRHASAAVGGKLYVFSGIGGEDEYLSTVEAYELYVFSGIGGEDEYLSTVEAYDPVSDSWAQATSLTSARSLSVAAAL